MEGKKKLQNRLLFNTHWSSSWLDCWSITLRNEATQNNLQELVAIDKQEEIDDDHDRRDRTGEEEQEDLRGV